TRFDGVVQCCSRAEGGTQVLLACRLFVAAVLVVAAVTKLLDRTGTRTTIVAFGLPPTVAAPLAVIVPVTELLVAGLLLPATTVVAGAIGAVALLTMFLGLT